MKEHGSLGREIASQLDEFTLMRITEDGFINAKKNAPWIGKGKDILALQGTSLMEGSSALVIAAGPSLHRFETAKIIKESNFKGIIIAAESAMAWCFRNGIIPHVVVTLDPHSSRIIRWFGDPQLTEESVQADDYYSRQDMDPAFRQNQLQFNRELIDLVNTHAPKVRIAISSSASPGVVQRVTELQMEPFWWNPMYDDFDKAESLTQKIHDMNGLPCINAGGNVGSACWVIAHAVLQKKKVGLVGVDFGYYADTPYYRTQYYNEILNLVGPDRLDEVFIRIKNPHLNQDFYTDPAYFWYRESFLEMAQQAECETVNCTGGGILFGNNIRWQDLSQFLEESNG